ncbi:MAG: FAD-dependent oxidoreductase, partial [Litorimonas sp.]
MADPLKIAVIGAGLIGLSCADALMQAAPANTVAVSVFEKNTGPVRGTSFCNSGMIHPSQSQSWGLDGQVCDALTHAANVSVYDLATRSRRILLENFERLNLTKMLNRPKGCVQIYADISAAQSAQQAFGQYGIDSSILMDDVNTLGHAGILFPDDMSGNARLYGEGLAASLKSRGVHIMYGITDIRFRPQDMGVVIELRDSATAAQTLAHFDHVILAAGPQSREVLKPLGLSIQMDLVKGH